MVVDDNVFLSYARKGTPGENAAKESFISHFKVENRVWRQRLLKSSKGLWKVE